MIGDKNDNETVCFIGFKCWGNQTCVSFLKRLRSSWTNCFAFNTILLPAKSRSGEELFLRASAPTAAAPVSGFYRLTGAQITWIRFTRQYYLRSYSESNFLHCASKYAVLLLISPQILHLESCFCSSDQKHPFGFYSLQDLQPYGYCLLNVLVHYKNSVT